MINVHTLRATVSGEAINGYDPSRNMDKLYRGHLTYIGAQGWVAWVEHGRSGEKQVRSLVTKSPISGVRALALLNERVATKNRKAEYPSYGGQISAADLKSTIDYMDALAQIAA